MSFVSGPVTVRVPASSANLGPGFDSLGLALSLYDELTAHVDGDDLQVEVTGEGAKDVALDENHLVVRAMHATFDLLGVEPPALKLRCRNAIPHGRGMGSSSSAIVGGIVLARTLAVGGADRLDEKTMYQLACDLEGHPDNVAAALFGGLTIAWIEGAAAAVCRRRVSHGLTVFIPADAVKTEVARQLLPDSVSHADASANAGRAALLVAALDGAPEFLYAATEDRLHQSFRASAMPHSYKLLRQLRADGVPAIISGAGPTVLCFATGIADWCPQKWTTMELAVDDHGATILDA